MTAILVDAGSLPGDCPQQCRGCGRGPLVPWGTAPEQGGLRHAGRGLCRSCHGRHHYSGTLDRFPRLRRQEPTRDELLNRWIELRDSDLTMTQIAERIGVSRSSLTERLARAYEAGDPRGRKPGRRGRPATGCRRLLDDAELMRLRRMVGVG